MAYLAFGCRCLLLAVFAFSAWGKLRDAAAFRVATAQLVPAARRYATPLAVVVVAAELAAVVLLAALPPAGLGIGLALLVAFTAAIAAALRRGGSAPCRCFGASTRPLGARHLVRNAFLLLVTTTGLVATSFEPVGSEPAGFAMAVATAAVLTALVLSFDALADLFTHLERTTT